MHAKPRIVLATLLVVALITTALTGSGCVRTGQDGQQPPSNVPQKGGTMTFSIGNPNYIDPYNAFESEGIQVEQVLFDSLTAFDPLNPDNVVPAAAESWSSNPDGSVWTFKLRRDAQFSDGTTVTASDFIYAWNRIASPATVNTSTRKRDPSLVYYHLSQVEGFAEVQSGDVPEMKGLKAIDDYTLEVTLSSPFADFDYVVAHPALAPVPKKYVQGGIPYKGRKVPFGDMPIGNGPFKMAEPWAPNRFIKVVRNERYKNGPAPYLDGVDFLIFKDLETAYREFEAGNLDFTQIGAGKIKDAQTKYGTSDNGYTANPGKQVVLGALNSTVFLVFNVRDESMSNPDLRRAVSLAINRQAIADVAFEGTTQPADNIVSPGIAGYTRGQWVDSKYDKAGAQAALVAAGYPNGQGLPTIKLSFNNDGGHERMMQLIQADLQAVGIKAEFDSTDSGAYLAQLDARDFAIGRLEWPVDYPIMDNFLYPLFNSKSTQNKGGYRNPDVDEALDDARAMTDQQQRIRSYQEINNTIQSDNPAAPLTFGRMHSVASSRVNNFTYSAQGLGDFTQVWLTESKEGSEEQ
ncbi:MAG: ABC transporter substrate-binding protein [Coriobacteriales bacterium]|nr:ABC transporter substrate-binding protein [Coriobacteriales bacterium]